MAALSAELKDWLAARTAEEKEAVFWELTSEVVKKHNGRRQPILEDFQRLVKFVSREEDPEAWQTFDEWLARAGVREELQKRLHSQEETLSVEEFMSEFSRLRKQQTNPAIVVPATR